MHVHSFAVEISMVVIESSDSELVVEVQCLKIDYTSKLEIEIRADLNITNSVTCSREYYNHTVTFGVVDCNKNYNLSAVWISPGNISFGEECLLLETSSVYLHCPGKYICACEAVIFTSGTNIIYYFVGRLISLCDIQIRGTKISFLFSEALIKI